MVRLSTHRISFDERHLLRGTMLLARIEETTTGQWIILDPAERLPLIADRFETAAEAISAAKRLFSLTRPQAIKQPSPP